MRLTRIGVVFLTGALASEPLALSGQDGVPRVTLAEALEAFGENSPALRIARAEAAGIAGRARPNGFTSDWGD